MNIDRIGLSSNCLYMEAPTPPFLHASSYSKATCLFEYRIELYWRLALVLIPPPKTIRSCQRDMQMHRASEMPLLHFLLNASWLRFAILQRGMFIDSRYLWEANTWWWADDAYIEMEGTYTLIGLTVRALPLIYYIVNMW